jgi:UDP-galactopyranose mutase
VHFSIARNGAASASSFIAAAEEILTKVGYKEWLEKVNGFLSGISWDRTWERMNELINTAIEDKRKAKRAKRYV